MASVRILSDHVSSPSFQGQQVRAVGKLHSMDAASGSVQLELLGGEPSTVTVSCPNGTHKYPLEQVGKGYFEVTGTLQGGGAITEMATVPMGEQLDTDMYVNMVKLTHQFPDIF